MTIQTIAIVADVPEDQTTAAQAAAAAFVGNLPENAEGTVIVSAVFGGDSLIPSPADAFAAALENLRQVTTRSPRASADDVAAAVARVDTAAKALELSLATGGPQVAPAAPADAAAAVNADTIAATAPAPTGEAPPADVAPVVDDANIQAGLPEVPVS